MWQTLVNFLGQGWGWGGFFLVFLCSQCVPQNVPNSIVFFFISFVLAKVELFCIHKYYIKVSQMEAPLNFYLSWGSAQFFKKIDNEPINMTPPLQINKYTNFGRTLD